MIVWVKEETMDNLAQRQEIWSKIQKLEKLHDEIKTGNHYANLLCKLDIRCKLQELNEQLSKLIKESMKNS
jgi:uncharacterized protein YacL (UPF0231 family)